MEKNITMMAKDEVSVPNDKPCCARAFLSALVHSSGSVIISEGKVRTEVFSSYPRVLRAAKKLLYTLYGIRCVIEKKTLSVADGALELLFELGIIGREDTAIVRGIKEEIIADECCKYSYCKGVFLATGTVYAPKKGGYHLEMRLGDLEFADSFSSLLFELGLTPRIRIKNDKPAVYVKSMEGVSDFLALVGAGGAVLALNNVAAERQMREIANRSENCDLANIERTVSASMKLVSRLEGILDKIEDKTLADTARARIKFPDSTYAELAGILGISKSGLAHRLKKLYELSVTLAST